MDKHLKEMINGAELISFDLFDTLVFRIVNTPETIFDLVGQHFEIDGFIKLRMDEQNEANRRAYIKNGYPHANIHEIYDVLAEHTEFSVAWDQVKAYEIQMEIDSLVANPEMKEVYAYARGLGKRIVITTDMYVMEDTIRQFLDNTGYTGFDAIYCSADSHKTKYKGDLFSHIHETEKIAYENILHIGSKLKSDVENAGSFGIRTYLYSRKLPEEKTRKAITSDVDTALYIILADERKSFWYRLGVQAGGPLYMALYKWIEEKTEGKKTYFMSRTGYNLYQLLKRNGYTNIEYLYCSHSSMLMAGTVEMDEESIALLPPYTLGQTVEEILNYLHVDSKKLIHLQDSGFQSCQDRIETLEDKERFKELYRLDSEVFLKQCQKERKATYSYFEQIGFLKEDAFVFDCGWNGSSQLLLERLKNAIHCETKNSFLYFGILNTEKARHQLHGLHYETFAFNFYQNYDLQRNVEQSIALYELFFSAPHSSVISYSEKGEAIFEDARVHAEKKEILDGIVDFVDLGYSFVKKYNVEYNPQIAMGALDRLVRSPSIEEAIRIGNLDKADGFVRKKAEHNYIARVSRQQFEENPQTEIYWMEGLFTRDDISENLKKDIALQRGLAYPKPPEPEYHLEDEQSIRNYHRFIDKHKHETKIKKDLNWKPFFSVVMPVYNTISSQLSAAIESVLDQTYRHFELILVDDCSTWDNVVPVLRSFESNEHVKTLYRSTNGNISVATNDGLKMATGDYIVFMDCDDLITEDALEEFAYKLNENPELDFIYSDEDKITEDGKILHYPYFKPDWSPDLFLSMMYTNHLGVYRASLVHKTGGLRTAYNGSQDYDFTLRFLELSDNKRVGHIQKVLYHWRERKESVGFSMGAKNYAIKAAECAKKDALRRRNIRAKLEFCSETSQYLINYEPQGNPLVSIIIPSKDHPEIIEQCLRSIQDWTEYRNYEIIVVDNGSTLENKQRIEDCIQNIGGTYLYGRYDFNFSYMCNLGATSAKGEYLLFLNDDIEIIQGDWLGRMLGQAQQGHTGAVGAKLFYPETTIIQHAGVSLIKFGPSHNLLKLNDHVPYHLGINRGCYNCIAVTGACLMVSKDIFNQALGFDESLPVAYNDVDLCMRIYEAGYYNVIRNDVVAYHHESLSRGIDFNSADKLRRLFRERYHLNSKHPLTYLHDPFLNRNINTYYYYYDSAVKYESAESVFGLPMTENGICNIDSVLRSDRVIISGWSCLPERTDNEELQRFLVFEDIYGNRWKAKARSVTRMDVAMAMHREDLLHSGFECVLDPCVFRNDLMIYRLGILTSVDGQNYISWRQQPLFPEWHLDSQLPFNELITEPFEAKSCSEIPLRFHLDTVQQLEDGFLIRGWAFFEDPQEYLYKPEIILVDEKGKTTHFEADAVHRLDVSNAYPQMHFLYTAGFRCSIYAGHILMNHSYKIILRMTNTICPERTYDYPMGSYIHYYTTRGRGANMEGITNPDQELIILRKCEEENHNTIMTLVSSLDQKIMENDNLLQQINRLTEERDSLRVSVQYLQTQNDSIQKSFDELQGLYAISEREYQRISNASFWRMTKPARAVLDAIKAVRNRMQS